jgi:hypothetical protein
VPGYKNLRENAAVEDVSRPNSLGFAGTDKTAFFAVLREHSRELSNFVETHGKHARRNGGLRLRGHVSRETRRA